MITQGRFLAIVEQISSEKFQLSLGKDSFEADFQNFKISYKAFDEEVVRNGESIVKTRGIWEVEFRSGIFAPQIAQDEDPYFAYTMAFFNSDPNYFLNF